MQEDATMIYMRGDSCFIWQQARGGLFIFRHFRQMGQNYPRYPSQQVSHDQQNIYPTLYSWYAYQSWRLNLLTIMAESAFRLHSLTVSLVRVSLHRCAKDIGSYSVEFKLERAAAE